MATTSMSDFSHKQFVILFLLAQVKLASSFSKLHLMKTSNHARCEGPVVMTTQTTVF
jgi:hypothetical protein